VDRRRRTVRAFAGNAPTSCFPVARRGKKYSQMPRENAMETQCDKILYHLQRFGSIDPIQAIQEYGVLRLAARINDLRVSHTIETHLVDTINRFGDPVRYARYVLVKPVFEMGLKP
jgi:hypothetical protein